METMNHEYYVSLEVAKLLKESGFDWECDRFYDCTNSDCVRYEEYSAPTLEVVQRWLREVKKICITVFPVENRFTFVIVRLCEKFNQDDYILEYNTYEEAQEAGIKEAFKIINQD